MDRAAERQADYITIFSIFLSVGARPWLMGAGAF